MRFHQDHRRRFVGDIFDTEDGDVNLVTLYPGIVIAWHRHQWQTDWLYCAYGSVLVQAIDPDGKRHTWALDSPHGQAVTIPPKWWHGYSSQNGATILQYNGPKKWTGEDEERMSLEEMPWISL